MSASYKLLLLDADNTLFDFGAAERYAIRKTFSDFGWEDNDEIYACYHACNDALWKALERKEVTRGQLKVLRFLRTGAWMKEHGYTLPEHYTSDINAMSPCYLRHLGEGAMLLSGAMELCRDLSAKYRLCIVTNGTASVQYSRMERSRLNRYFEHIFISEEIGAEKPAKQFFDAVFAAYPDIDRREMLVIGDSASSDMKGAMNAGIDGCYLNESDPPAGVSVRYHVANYQQIRNILL